MIVNVWLIYKDGEDRVYTTAVKPSDWSLSSYRTQGFRVYRAEVDLPVDEETPVVKPSDVGEFTGGT